MRRPPQIFLGATAAGTLFSPPQICTLVLGPPRSGKTTSIIIPNVLMASSSLIVISTKADIFHATQHRRRNFGGISLFDPTDAMGDLSGVHRSGWSPLVSAHAWERAVLNADAMVGASVGARSSESNHWLERAGALLASLFHAGALAEMEMHRVLSAIHRRSVEEFVEILSVHDANLALDLLTGILATDPREQSGIWSTAAGVLSAYRTETVLRSATYPAISWEEFIHERRTLYVISPSDHQQQVAPLIAGLLRDLRSVTYAISRGEGATPPPVLLILDELANIAPLHDLPALIAEGASQGVLTLATLQDLSQARQRWGTAGDAFLSLFGTKIVLPGIGDQRTLRDLSLLAGDHWVATRSFSRPVGPGRRTRIATTASLTRVPRLPPSSIANPRHHTATVIIGATSHRVELRPHFAGASD